ncbi:hypothetical protein J7W08_03345 [Methanococcoides orientis]|uniref:hypothetical protein n=1 Tax=Methanococcoides orientis TaxID=2822137 RepID=UPI001E46CEE4|nr:hypothetical protein [Methanococcoides orientis]UGV41344.1 hypothetical protein J7W08_03345 [Methanococcoides orientis]
MKLGTIKGFAIIATVLMMVSLLPITALADTVNGFEAAPGKMQMNNSNETFGLQEQDRLRTQDRINIQEAKKEYNNLTYEFQMVKRQQVRGELTSEEMIDASKVYLNGTIDYMVLRLENIRDEGDYPEDVNETINSYIGEFELARVVVEEAETRKELSDAMRDIKKLWMDAIKDIRDFTSVKVGEKLENHIANTNRISERLQNEIREMEQNGEDVEDLQEMLTEYNELIAEAESLQEKGDVEEAIKKSREANERLRELLREMKQFRKGFVNMAGEGPLNAEGDGTIVLSGQLNATISATDAMLVVKDLARDLYIDVTGTYELVNEERAEDGYHAFVYHNFTGDAIIKGSRLTIMIRGEDITVFAEGDGSASLSGEGSYRIGEGAEAFVTEFAGEVSEAEEVNDEGVEEEISADLGTEGVKGADTSGQNDESNKPQED